MNNKFLVELHPSKHGKYQATEYQETYVHDMVSLTDALRHPILVQDKVLAPWEPEGERYAPGIVIDGQEKRIANGYISLVNLFEYNYFTIYIQCWN